MIRVLFVCHGNICRSPMAEYVFKDLVKRRGKEDKFYIASAAVSSEELGNPMHWGTRSILHQKGVPFGNHRATKFTADDYDNYDYIIIMDSQNERWIRRILNDDNPKKVHSFLSFAGIDRDIADPWYTGNFEETFNDVVKAANALFDYIERNGE